MNKTLTQKSHAVINHKVLRVSYDAKKKSLQSSITRFYALGISVLVTRPNTLYTPEHEDSLSFRLRKSNRTGYQSKTLGFSYSENPKKINKL